MRRTRIVQEGGMGMEGEIMRFCPPDKNMIRVLDTDQTNSRKLFCPSIFDHGIRGFHCWPDIFWVIW